MFDDVAKPNLWSRNGLPLEQKFPAIAKGVSKLKLRSTVLDGEIVAVDESGIPRFQLLQRFQKRPTAPTLYYVFYVLWTDGADITSKIVLIAVLGFRKSFQLYQVANFGGYVEGHG